MAENNITIAPPLVTNMHDSEGSSDDTGRAGHVSQASGISAQEVFDMFSAGTTMSRVVSGQIFSPRLGRHIAVGHHPASSRNSYESLRGTDIRAGLLSARGSRTPSRSVMRSPISHEIRYREFDPNDGPSDNDDSEHCDHSSESGRRTKSPSPALSACRRPASLQPLNLSLAQIPSGDAASSDDEADPQLPVLQRQESSRSVESISSIRSEQSTPQGPKGMSKWKKFGLCALGVLAVPAIAVGVAVAVTGVGAVAAALIGSGWGLVAIGAYAIGSALLLGYVARSGRTAGESRPAITRGNSDGASTVAGSEIELTAVERAEKKAVVRYLERQGVFNSPRTKDDDMSTAGAASGDAGATDEMDMKYLPTYQKFVNSPEGVSDEESA